MIICDFKSSFLFGELYSHFVHVYFWFVKNLFPGAKMLRQLSEQELMVLFSGSILARFGFRFEPISK